MRKKKKLWDQLLLYILAKQTTIGRESHMARRPDRLACPCSVTPTCTVTVPLQTTQLVGAMWRRTPPPLSSCPPQERPTLSLLELWWPLPGPAAPLPSVAQRRAAASWAR
jgi:hypothetical protein